MTKTAMVRVLFRKKNVFMKKNKKPSIAICKSVGLKHDFSKKID